MTLLVGDVQRTDTPNEARSLKSYLTGLLAVLARAVGLIG